MFYLRYLWAELTRRWSKTLTVTFGLAMASAIIIVIISVSQSLSTAQDKVLNPLQNVGTDIIVTRSVDAENMAAIDETSRNDMMEDNSIGMNLAELGDPGEAFSKDNFMPGSMLTFDAAEMDNLNPTLVKEAAAGLIMTVMHQEGTVPDITVDITTGGETFEVNEDIEPMTDGERAAQDAARTKAEAELKERGVDPRSHEGMEYMRDAMDAAMPERFRQKSMTFVAPSRTYRQEVGPIETNISTGNLTVAGVDTTKTDIGLILPGQVTSGAWFSGADQVIANKAYADKKSYALGGTIELGGKALTLVGIVEPQLYTNTADLYLPLADLQSMSGKADRINIILVKSTNAQSVEETSTALEDAFVGAKATDSNDTAKEVTGSLVNAANLTNRFIGVTSIIVIAAAFIIVSLLTVFSVNKRIREIGTLKAIGWSNTRIVRQVVAENIVLGVFGAVCGIGLAVGAIALMNHYDISLTATVANASTDSPFGFARRMFGGETDASNSTTTTVQLTVASTYLTMLLGSLVAIVGSFVAGTLAALKASKMKPQEALRNLE
ncbi:MAG: ABC transporter permease [Patescibacteria group bacterium]|nr:ABC transporter permease [Patescibacteria group bacterium]MDD5715319.1 ABC transporter permease [Patescibacteria group bacterium]